MSNKRKLNRSGAVLATGALLAAGLVGAFAGPAGADTLEQSNEPPVVSALNATGSATMQPDSDSSEGTYSVTATVSDANTVQDLTTVSLCMYLDGASDTCASPDGTTQALLTWTQATDTFAMNDGAGAYWVDATSTENYSAGNDDMGFTFNFKVSEAARAGNWNAKVIAVDDAAASDSEVDTSNTMAYYANVDTNRAAQDYGSLAAGGTSNKLDISSGTIQANGSTDVFYAAGSFNNPVESVNLTNYQAINSSVAVTPAEGSYALDCQSGATFTQGSSTRVATVATEITSAAFTTGTAEGGASDSTASCRLTNGGGVPTGTYTGTVQVTVGAAS